MLENVGDLLVLNASRFPDKDAIVYRGQRITYRELNERVNRLANHLKDLGIKKGDHVGFQFYNSNQFVESFFAVQKIGALAIPMSFRLVSREVKWILDNARCKVFIYSDAVSQVVDPIKKDFSTVEYLICSGISVPPGEYDFEKFCREGSIREPKVTIDWDDRARIQFTGGTTGIPKAAVYSHRTSIFSGINVAMVNKLDGHSVCLSQIPNFHSGGMALMLAYLVVGCRFFIVEAFDPLEILNLIEQEKATFLILLPPSTLLRLMEVPTIKEYDLSSVESIMSGAGGMTRTIALKLLDTFPRAAIRSGWAMTEGGNVGISNLITRKMVEEDFEKVTSVGTENPFIEVRIVDEQGRDCPQGEVGELIMRSPTLMLEYFGQPQMTAEAIKDGWLFTGDLFKKDRDGYYYIVDRKKDMIKSGGENVYAQEVEATIRTLPAVENCAVIGVPDVKFGEAIMAVVKLREGAQAREEEIIEVCKRDLAGYKKPRQVVFVDGFPVDSVGKIQKFKLREQYGKE